MGCGCSSFETQITKIVSNKQTGITQSLGNTINNLNNNNQLMASGIGGGVGKDHPFAFPHSNLLTEANDNEKDKDKDNQNFTKKLSSNNNVQSKTKSLGFLQKIKQSRMLNLLSIYIEARTGVYVHTAEKDSALIARGLSPISLDNKIIDSLNYNIKRLSKTYKNQPYPKDTTTSFIDDYFPPNSNSLLGLDSDGNPTDKIDPRLHKLKNEFMFEPNSIVWLHAKEIFNSKFSIFVDDISIDDVRQGNLGNCYFMSSLAAMTTMPQLICQLFKSFEIPENNCYEISVNIDGEWRIVLLDDYFPCSKKTRVPIFAKPNGPELWAMLLEKAWAKINGGYLNITGGWASEVLSALTSFPIETIKLNFNMTDMIWEKLNSSFKIGEIISCCSNFNKDIEKYGLISGHAFTVTKFTDGFVSGELVRLIKLRNPWGYREWTGPWSDHSPFWTDEAKRELNANLVVSDDGEFWMSFDDFFNFFCVVDICKVTNPQCVKTIPIPIEKAEMPNVFEMQIFSKTKVVIAVNKKYYRYHRTLKTEQELTVNLLVVKKSIENGTFELLASTHKTDCNPAIELDFAAGFYLIYVHCNYAYSTFDKTRKVRLYVSSNKYFFLHEKGIDYDYMFLRRIMIDNLQKKLSLEESNGPVITLTSNKYEGTTYGFLIIKNITKSPLKYFIRNQSQNYALFPPFDNTNNGHNNLIHGISLGTSNGLSVCNITSRIYVQIPAEQCVIFVGIRKFYYEVYKFSLTLNNRNNPQQPIEYNEKMLNVQPFQINCPIKELDDNDYDFFFKKMEFDTMKIAESIDYKANAEKYFTDKYPKEMKMIVRDVMPLKDGEDVIFRDVFDLGNSYYIGEWKIKEEMTKHGRGLLVYSDGSSYLGQFINDKMEGKGKLLRNTIESIDITWKNGKMEGIGVLTKIDGTSKKVCYQDGKQIC